MTKLIPTVQIHSGDKFVNDKGIHAIKDGIKRSSADAQRLAKPEWLRMRIQTSPKFEAVKGIVHEHRLATVCEEAKCPNMSECWSAVIHVLLIMRVSPVDVTVPY